MLKSVIGAFALVFAALWLLIIALFISGKEPGFSSEKIDAIKQEFPISHEAYLDINTDNIPLSIVATQIVATMENRALYFGKQQHNEGPFSPASLIFVVPAAKFDDVWAGLHQMKSSVVAESVQASNDQTPFNTAQSYYLLKVNLKLYWWTYLLVSLQLTISIFQCAIIPIGGPLIALIIHSKQRLSQPLKLA